MLLSTILSTGLKLLVTAAAGTAIVLGVKYIFSNDTENGPVEEEIYKEEEPTTVTDGWGNTYRVGKPAEKRNIVSAREVKAQRVVQALQMGRTVIDNVIQIGNGLATMFNSIDGIFGVKGNGVGMTPYIPMCDQYQGQGVGTNLTEQMASYVSGLNGYKNWFIDKWSGKKIYLNTPIPYTDPRNGKVHYVVYKAPNIMELCE